MSIHLTKEQVAEYRDSFSLFDKNGDGFIDVSELKEVLRSMGNFPTNEELEDMISELDSDRDGRVDFEEFLKMMSSNKSPKEIESDIIDAFGVFDKDKNGFITVDELRQVMKSLGPGFSDEDLSEMIREADFDGDGRIDYTEFANIMGVTNQAV